MHPVALRVPVDQRVDAFARRAPLDGFLDLGPRTPRPQLLDIEFRRAHGLPKGSLQSVRWRRFTRLQHIRQVLLVRHEPHQADAEVDVQEIPMLDHRIVGRGNSFVVAVAVNGETGREIELEMLRHPFVDDPSPDVHQADVARRDHFAGKRPAQDMPGAPARVMLDRQFGGRARADVVEHQYAVREWEKPDRCLGAFSG